MADPIDVRNIDSLTVEQLKAALALLVRWARIRGHSPSCWGAEGDAPCSCGLREALGYEPTKKV